MANALKAARRKLDQEADKQIEIIFRALAIALGEEGWSLKRLEKVSNEVHEFVNELSKVDKSAVQICEEETGVCLIPEGIDKSWEELTFLNGEVWDKFIEEHRKIMKPQTFKAYVIRAQQKMLVWVRPQFYASVIVAMHRLYGYGSERAARLYARMYEIEKAAGMDPKKLDDELARTRKIRMKRPAGERFYFEAVK